MRLHLTNRTNKKRKMKKNILPFALLAVLAMTMQSCEAIGDILEVGVWLGIILVVVVIALVLWLIRKIRR